MIRRSALAAGLLAFSAVSAATSPMPRIVHEQGRHALLVNNQPYTVLAAQLHNSSAWPAVLPGVWSDVLALHPNTLQAPVYWEQFEPSRGHFDYTHVDALVEGARAHGLHLIVLWFGSWKNGQMHYVPEWIKTNPARYPRVLDAKGQPVDDLSTLAPANLEADKTAFAALMAHLKVIDGERHTVIMVQVENEPGVIGTVRDHSPEAEKAFNSAVPADLARMLGRPFGKTWPQLFGGDADEQFNAYGVAHYIDQVAAAGKAQYPLPMYVNTWLRYKTKHLPGDDYPSGGATWNVLDLWKATAPHIDLIGTDLYTDDYGEFTKVVGQYSRPDNPSWISETGFDAGNAPYLFHVLGKGGVGFSVFGVDGEPDTDARRKAVDAHARHFALVDSINRQVAAAAYQGSLRVAVEQRGQPKQVMALANHWTANVSFGAPHWGDAPVDLPGTPGATGNVLIVPLGPDEYLVSGFDARVEFARDGGDGKHGQLLRVEEGGYVDGQWKTLRWWNGDETDYGLNFGGKPVVLRVRLGSF